ncbi:hypothetical protein SAMN05421690_10061 [Nitrosomonas sp. Nm51]|uniref:hypothetical protein n=1 Tax=Nitrosomonas sp. Nm51 TaxID=133720 RepID=UPI0008BBFE76|nr:hypothetical protein [Nitrosomonas sp. Nm51]SER02220.1 hypothetical protein SAMN05421690_10061 [Nitrosomonas sp. Nm51]
MKAVVFLLTGSIFLAGCVTMQHEQRTDHNTAGEHSKDYQHHKVPQLSPELEQELLRLTNMENIGFIVAVDRNGNPLAIASSQAKSAEIFTPDERRPARAYSPPQAFSFVEIKKSHCWAMGLRSIYYPIGGVGVEICLPF